MYIQNRKCTVISKNNNFTTSRQLVYISYSISKHNFLSRSIFSAPEFEASRVPRTSTAHA